MMMSARKWFSGLPTADAVTTWIAFPAYFDRHERRLVLMAAIVGVVVWSVVFTLKALVHGLFGLYPALDRKPALKPVGCGSPRRRRPSDVRHRPLAG